MGFETIFGGKDINKVVKLQKYGSIKIGG